MEDHTWMVHLNVELTQQMAKYPNLSKEKVGPLLGLCLYCSSLGGVVAEPQDASLTGV